MKRFRYFYESSCIDCYTLVDTEDVNSNNTTNYVASGISPKAFWQHGELNEGCIGSNLGEEVTFEQLPKEVQNQWIEELQLQEIYAIGSADNARFICDLQEQDLYRFVSMGTIKILTDKDAVQGNEANYVLTDDAFEYNAKEKSLTKFLNS